MEIRLVHECQARSKPPSPRPLPEGEGEFIGASILSAGWPADESGWPPDVEYNYPGAEEEQVDRERIVRGELPRDFSRTVERLPHAGNATHVHPRVPIVCDLFQHFAARLKDLQPTIRIIVTNV